MATTTAAILGYVALGAFSGSIKVNMYSQYQMSKAQTRAANYNRLLRMQQAAAMRRQWGYEQTSLRQQIALQQQEAAVNHSMAVAEAQSRFNNAEMLRNQAEAEASLEREKIRQERLRLERLTSMQRARIAGSGVVESGSPLDVLAESGGEIEQALNEQHYQANIDRMQGMRQAALEEFGGKLAFADANTSAIGREYVYRLKDDEMTLGRAVQEKIASVAQLRQRAQIADRNLSDIDAAYDEAAFTSEALSNDLSDAEAARRILGSSRTEFKDGVYQTTITLYKGANELTVLEEKIEGDARLLLKDGRKGWMISALRDVEDKTGVRLFRKVADNSQLNNQDVVEAWSSLGVSYFTATSRKGEASTQGGVRPKGLDGVRTRQFFSRVMGTKMGAVLSAYGTFFREVWKQAAALNKARRDGKLDAELESTLRQQLGLGEAPGVGVKGSRDVDANIDVDANADLSTFTETSFSQLPLRKQAFYWKQQLGKLFAGTLDKTHPLLFGKTPAVLEAVGADPLPLVMDINVVTKAREKHGLSIKQLQDIFEEVHDPIAIFQSHRLDDSQVVLTSLEHHGDPLIVAVHLDRFVQHHKVNKIESVYAKSAGVVKEWLSDGSTLQYLNTKKSHLLALSRGLQLPKEATLQKGRRQYLTEEDIVNLPDRSEFTRQATPPPQTSDTASPESDTKNKLGGNTFALAPLGAGFHRITAAPPVVSLTDTYPDTLAKPSEYRSYFWKNFDEITRDWPAVIDTPEGPITWTKSKTGDKLKFFKDGEPAKLHFIAAANLPELLKNSTLVAVQKEGKADETVAEVHRRYAWAEFPDGTRRHILLTVDRMSELARPEQQLADRAYSSEVLGVSIEILPENKGADAVNLKEPSGTSPSGDQALTSAQRELNRFLAGIKPEHKPQSSTGFSVLPDYYSPKSGSKSNTETNPHRNENGDLIIAENKALEARSELKALDAKFKRIVADSTQADALYNALPESKKGKVINTDIARKMLPEYAASPNGALNFVSATDAAAKSYVADRLWRELENPRGRRTFMMTGGGMGAGKSTVVNDAIVNLRDLVFDGTLRNADQAIKTIHQALKNGWNVEIRYVKRPFELAAQGVIDRAQAEGRWLHLADLEFAHYEAQKSIVKIAKHFANNPSVNISYWLNDGTTKMEPAKKLTLSQIDEGGEYSYTKSDEQRLDRTRNQRGRRGNAEWVSGETTAGGGETALHGIFRAAASSGLYSPEVIRNLAGDDQKLRSIVAERGTESSVDYKLSQYLLNHDNPNGKDKAIWFEQALGFNKNNAYLLAKQLVFNKDSAVQIGITQQGTKFNQMIDIKGANGRTARIRVSWILNLDGVVRIVTAVPRP